MNKAIIFLALGVFMPAQAQTRELVCSIICGW